MKSHPFKIVMKVPYDIHEGSVLRFDDESFGKVTKIKSIMFLDLRTIEVTGLVRSVNEKGVLI